MAAGFFYIRFFVVWLIIITMDFALEFRFEFLWPFWLLIRSSFDSFRYQGMGLTMVFLCITLLSDVICFMFLPVHWLFFVASTYVWVQFAITTERGPCIATISLWLLFVYVEASVRLREIRSMPFHLDICRPFAAHCIGYPVVSLGYGFKSYVGYKMKNYRKVEVCKQNEFYQQLVAYALPVELQNMLWENSKKISLANGINTKTEIETISTTDTRKKGAKLTDIDLKNASNNGSLSLNDLDTISGVSGKDIGIKRNSSNTFEPIDVGFVKVPKSNQNNSNSNFTSRSSNEANGSTALNKRNAKNKQKQPPESDYELEISDSEESAASIGHVSHDSSPKSNRVNNKNDNHNHSHNHNQQQAKLKEEQAQKRKTDQLENEVKRLRNELHSVRETEVEYRTQVNASLIAERYLKSELGRAKSDNENLQQKLSSFASLKSQDKTLITSLERKLKIEKDNRASLEAQLKESVKKSSQEAVPIPRVENHDACNSRVYELESEISKLKEKIDESNQCLSDLKKLNAEMKQRNSENDTEKMKKDIELLTNALNAMQGKNMHLENSLSSETRLKLDLFSALGDTRRQLEIVQGQMKGKCLEVELLRGKLAEVMAVMPNQYNSAMPFSNKNESKAVFLPSQNGKEPVAAVTTTSGYSPSVSPQNGVA